MLYFLGKTISYLVYKTLYRLKIEGRENIPDNTGYIIASNHNSYADPPIIGASMKQPVYFMAKKELFAIPLFGWLISRLHAYPVDRNAPQPSSIKNTIKLLKEGKTILIFPEGTRKSNDRIHSGLAFLAHKAGVPVLPSRIFNNHDMHRFNKLRYKVGEPVRFHCEPGGKTGPDAYRKFAEYVMERINGIE